MKTGNRFSDFIRDRLGDDVWKRAKTFCKLHAANIVYNQGDPRYERYFNLEYFGVSDVEIKDVKVWDDNASPDSIVFDVIVNPTVVIYGQYSKHGDCESFPYDRLWLRLQYTAKVSDDGIKDCRFQGSEIYDAKKCQHSLDGSLIPYVSRDQYDDIAHGFLLRYFPEALQKGTPVDPAIVAKRMGLVIQERRIRRDGTVFGQSFFCDGRATFYDAGKDADVEEQVKAGTIVIDPDANATLSFNSRNITVIHECLHFYLHAKAVRFAKALDHRISSLRCLSTGSLDNQEEEEDFKFAEIQANAIAPCVLMPRKQFIDAFKEEEADAQIIAGNKIENYGPLVIESLASRFAVTIYAAKKRLIDLGYVMATGMLEFADEKYVKPYLFSKGSLREGETFTVSFSDLAKGLNQNVFTLFFNGAYRFIENHVVFNSSKYIAADGTLTDYARVHLDECAVRFKIRAKSSFFGREFAPFATFCYLCRGIRDDMKFEIVSTREPDSIPDIESARRESNDRIRAIHAGLVSKKSVSEMLKYLLEEFGMNPAALARRSHLSERTISRYLKEGKSKYDLRSMISICLAFNLPPKLSNVLVSTACGSIPDNDEDRPLESVLMYMYDKRVEEANEYLVKAGCEPLTRIEE